MLIVGTDVKYGSASNTANAALTPNLLDVGSVGIYTVDTDGTFKLVTDVATGTGLVPSASVKTGFLKIAQGLGNGDFFVSEYHDVLGIKSITGSKYRAGAGETIYIGYNPVTGVGDINFILTSAIPTTPYYNIYHREGGVKLRQRLRGNNSYGPDIFFNTVVGVNDTGLTVLTNVNTLINAYQDDGILGYPFTSTITGNFLAPPVQTAAATAGSGGTIPAATYYAKIVFYGTNGNSLGSNEQSVVASGGSSTITFNWSTPPTGTTSSRVFVSTTSGVYTSYYNVASSSTATLTLTALGSPVTGTIPTSTALGLAIAVADIYASYEAAVYDGLQNAIVSKVDKITPSGDPYELQGTKGNYVKNEIESNIYRGDLYTMSTIEKKLPKTIDLTKTYDTYLMTSINTSDDKTGSRAQVDNKVSTIIAFVVQGNTVGTDQQADFEAILTAIFPATSQISA